jgi:putative redox protein
MYNVEVSLKRVSGLFHLETKNLFGQKISTDGAPSIGGTGKGLRPMELVLSALGSCSAVDVILILKKQRQKLEDIQIHIQANRVKVGKVSEYRDIHLHFYLFGDIKPKKAEQALMLSLEEYCSVAHLLRHTTNITYAFSINKPFDEKANA